MIEQGRSVKRGTCPMCGDEFQYTRKQRFCGRACSNRARGTRNYGQSCAVEGCGRPAKGKGLCGTHYWRATRSDQGLRPDVPVGDIERPRQKTDAYKRHRRAMEKILGRPLERDEIVHHKNGDRRDNSPENLELWVRAHPCGQRVDDRVMHAVDLLRRYRPDLLAEHHVSRERPASTARANGT